MTAPTAARRGGAAGQMTLDPMDEAAGLIRELLTVLNDRMTPQGHPYALVLREHRGTCPPYEDSLRCRVYRDLFVRGTAWLSARDGGGR